MQYLTSFLFVGAVCLIAQVLLDNTKLTVGHITSIFVVIGAALDIFNIYDKIITRVGGGALVPITSFGHLLAHGAMIGASQEGLLGIAMGMFNLTAAGITSVILFSFVFSLIFKPKN